MNNYYSASKLDERQNRTQTDAPLAGQYHKGRPLNTLLLSAVHNDCNGQPVACAIRAHMKDPISETSDEHEILREKRDIDNPFDAFDTWNLWVSTEKTQDGDANLTHLTDLTPNRRGCTWRTFTPARAPAARLFRHTPFNRCQMRQTRQIPGAVLRFGFDVWCQTGCQFDTKPQSGVAQR
nr:MAG: hypothetical protein J07AB56_03350 [Candidatus Nanosalinarum sp. J07AB56]